jgi:Heavy metal binding domain
VYRCNKLIKNALHISKSVIYLKIEKMKINKILFGAAIFVALGTTTLVSCGGDKAQHEHAAGAYQCPMQCEGDKTYEAAGKCPQCDMDLEKKEEHTH